MVMCDNGVWCVVVFVIFVWSGYLSCIQYVEDIVWVCCVVGCDVFELVKLWFYFDYLLFVEMFVDVIIVVVVIVCGDVWLVFIVYLILMVVDCCCGFNFYSC